jgi:anti-sigma regulatory factor (Ser/Thr protein kinase)
MKEYQRTEVRGHALRCRVPEREDGAEEPRQVWQSPPEPGAIAEARDRAERVLGGWGLDRSTVELVVLIVSELVTNAHRHAKAAAEVELVLLDGGVRLGVADPSPRLPEVQPLDPARPGGHGLHMVARVSRRWGVDRRPRGKQVWAFFAA